MSPRRERRLLTMMLAHRNRPPPAWQPSPEPNRALRPSNRWRAVEKPPKASFCTPWLTEPEAAEYCRCSLRAFRHMRLPAQNSGGRKVYNRANLDAALLARPWYPSSVRTPLAITTPKSDELALLYGDRLTARRLRPYKPRKHDGIDRTPKDADSYVPPTSKKGAKG